MQTQYFPTLSGKELKQIRAMAEYSDGSWKEICEETEKIYYINNNPEIVSVDSNGLIYPTGIVGTATVSVHSEDLFFDVEIIVKE